MSATRPDLRSIRRLLRLRMLEEERAEDALRAARQQRQQCVASLDVLEERQSAGTRHLFQGLSSAQREDAIAAQLLLACGPMKKHRLQWELAACDAEVERSASLWRESNLRRQQMESISRAGEASRRQETLLREQKGLDSWYLSSGAFAVTKCRAEQPDENSPRNLQETGLPIAMESSE